MMASTSAERCSSENPSQMIENIKTKVAKLYELVVERLNAKKKPSHDTSTPFDGPLPKMDDWIYINRNVRFLANSESTEKVNLKSSDEEEEKDFEDDVLVEFVDMLKKSSFFEQFVTYMNIMKIAFKSPDHTACLMIAFTFETDETYYANMLNSQYSRATHKEAHIDSAHKKVSVPDLEEQTSAKYYANIDADQPRAYTCEEALDSFRVLICDICYTFDCQMHIYEKPSLPFPPFEDLSITITESCGKDCFLTARKSLLANESLIKDIPNSVQTLINVFLPTFQNHYCKISKMVGKAQEVKLTCAQICAYDRITNKKSFNKQKCSQEVASTSGTQNKDISIWTKAMRQSKKNSKERVNYQPCVHEGSCKKARCVCYKNGTSCERFCHCAIECKRRFSGCQCKSSAKENNSPQDESDSTEPLCSSTNCICFASGRECDPVLCETCDAGCDHELPEYKTPECQNVALQRGLGKMLLMAVSDVAGWGAFLNGTAEKDELIVEYVGKLITSYEADERGIVYDEKRLSYLFDLNAEWTVDAARMGNLSRFINHSKQYPNCNARVSLVNGEHRIGIYAGTFIDDKEELFFDYGYDRKAKQFVNIERPYLGPTKKK